MDFKAKLKDVPELPGVYLMLGENEEIIYVGKAKNLRKRLRQYFYDSVNKPTKVQKMVEHIVDFRYIICASEIDALVSENNLIKKHTPKYNILLKDDKTYPYIRINTKEEFPTVELVRNLKNDGAKYFGPYMVSVNIRDIFDLIHTAFKIRDCNRDLTKPSRPCLNMHLGRCLAPCSGKVTHEEYMQEVDKVIEFLKGNDRQVEKQLNEKMRYFADQLNFEVAMDYRDKLKVLDRLVRKQISAIPQDLDMDFFALESNGVVTAVSMLVVRGGKMVGGENQASKTYDEDLASYIYQYYKLNPPLCHEIVIDGIESKDALESAINELSDHVVHIVTPSKGVKKQLLDLAHSNAHDAMQKHGTLEDRKEMRTVGAVEELQDILKLPVLPNRIECYDISHISGTDKVASMVVFEGGEPKKAHYRKFKVKVPGNNDFASMKEILKRRLMKLNDEDQSFSSFPDLIVVDGGKGQLTYAIEALNELGLYDKVNMIALAERDEEVYQKIDPKEPLIISKDDLALQLLQRVRDEAHRFAITFHRSLRNKRLSETQLTKIPGIGKVKATLLIKNFGSVEGVKNATVDQIAAIQGFSYDSAEWLINEVKKFK